jgi:DNA-directed RNA polymerase specialized sigma24 family protein
MIGRGYGRTVSDSIPIAPDVDPREIRNLRAYLFRITTNLWIDEVRRARAQELLDRWMPVKGESLFETLARLPNARVEVCDLAAAERSLSPPA